MIKIDPNYSIAGCRLASFLHIRLYCWQMIICNYQVDFF